MIEGFPHPSGEKEPADIPEEFNFKPEIDLTTFFNMAVEYLKITPKEVMRVVSNAIQDRPPLTDDELIDLYNQTSGNLIRSEVNQNNTNKLFLQIQDMNEELDKDKNSFINMIKLDKTSIIAKWGKAGWMGVSLIGSGIGALITFLATLN